MPDAEASERSPLLGVPLGVSAALHVAIAAAVFLLRPDAPPTLPPVYRVDIVAAPPGPRQAGVVRPPESAPPTATPTPPRPPKSEAPTREPAVPIKAPQPTRTSTPPATPLPPRPADRAPTTPAPTAGGGPTGGRGTDVATVRTEGIEFPYPGYLNNIVRQIALHFTPPNPNAPLRAEVFFLIHRDGTVTGVRFITRSGNYQFDLEAQGAIEAASPQFGALPSGFTEDALPVVFTFDPRVLR
ncbi:MAG TPA: TonB C-terminal domain-containing protein [Gemmatimonadaceae bacterium]|nr:TonB C-terminal domain-containing protein [Gemmatimonadaceae bacterium]